MAAAMELVIPKLLPCHHVYCDECVNTMMNGSTLVCPTCRRECHANEIRSDFTRAEFIRACECTGNEWMSHKQWRHQHSVSVPGTPNCLRLIQGELWQCLHSGITVYDSALQDLRSMDCGNMYWVYDVASLPGGEVVVAAYNGLYRMTASGEQRDQIAEGWFTGVVHHRGRVYTADYRTGTVHVYEHLDGLTECCSFTVNATNSSIITLGVSKDLLYVCLSRDHRLDVFSLAGVLKYSTGRRGSDDAGQLNSPFICATNAAGAALIADRHNNRLQMVSARHQWSTVTLQPPVERPYSALLLGGKLYTSDDYTRKLCMHE